MVTNFWWQPRCGYGWYLAPSLTSPPVDAVPGISAAPSEENLRYFNVVIFGPDSSPYQGVNLG